MVCGWDASYHAVNLLSILCITTRKHFFISMASQLICCVYSVFLFPSSSVDVIASRLLSDNTFLSFYIKENRSRIAAAYAHVTELLRRHKILHSAGINAAFFLWVELRSVYLRGRDQSKLLTEEEGAKLDEEINHRLMNSKVYLDMGTTFGAEKGGWWRLVFSHPGRYMKEGLKRVLEALS